MANPRVKRALGPAFAAPALTLFFVIAVSLAAAQNTAGPADSVALACPMLASSSPLTIKATYLSGDAYSCSGVSLWMRNPEGDSIEIPLSGCESNVQQFEAPMGAQGNYFFSAYGDAGANDSCIVSYVLSPSKRKLPELAVPAVICALLLCLGVARLAAHRRGPANRNL